MDNLAGSLGSVQNQSTVAIIGAGFSGTMLAVELLRRAEQASQQVSVVLIGRDAVPGRGVAYGTQFEGHLLNVRAKGMSAYADTPDHFVKWAQQHYSASVKPEDFLPRRVYGQYISSQLREAVSLQAGESRCIQDEAVSLERAGGPYEISLAGGKTVIADKVVLALGNFAPADPNIPGMKAESTRFISNPWSGGALSNAAYEGSLLLIGSGLTSIDVTIELRARGFEGTIHIVSRHGLLPQRHAAAPALQFSAENIPRTARGLLRLIRLQVAKAEGQGVNWRAVIDSLRPFTQQIWQALPVAEKRGFQRHLQTYWDVHRHRIAERIADQVNLQLRGGQIELHAGRVTEYRESADGVDVTYRERRRGESKTLRVDRVINCTGPQANYRRVRTPLLLSLVERKLARFDDLALGLDVASDGAVINDHGSASKSIYALGPLRKGTLWETTAVPELRVQVAELAKLLVRQLPAKTNASIAAMNEVLAVVNS